MTDLIVDPRIRTWVFLPIVIMTFLVGILRHYLFLLLKSEKTVELKKIRESQSLVRAQLLRKNGQYIGRAAFDSRRSCFLADNVEYLEEDKQQVPSLYGMADNKTTLKDTFLENMLNYLPMVMMGSWLMYMLSGFIIAKIPIPLTLKFKHMLQKDIFLEDLDAEWVSSASWYFLNVFGMRSIYVMVLGENNCSDHYTDHVLAPPANAKECFKNEMEALVMYKHECEVKGVI